MQAFIFGILHNESKNKFEKKAYPLILNSRTLGQAFSEQIKVKCFLHIQTICPIEVEQ